MPEATHDRRPPRKERAPRKGPWSRLVAYLRHRHDPLTSLVLTIPVFVFYHLGILLIDLQNGVDLVSQLMLQLLDRSVLAYIGVTLGVAAGLSVAAFFLRKKGKLKPARVLPVLAESVLLAVLMMLTVGWATNQVFAAQIGSRALDPFEKLVMATGAGFHEELIFRVGLFAGGAWLLARVKKIGRVGALLIAAFASSLIFSAIHYVGDLPYEFTLVSFTFRVFAGLFLVAVYQYRGFAVAVYTHTFYDVIVFFLVS